MNATAAVIAFALAVPLLPVGSFDNPTDTSEQPVVAPATPAAPAQPVPEPLITPTPLALQEAGGEAPLRFAAQPTPRQEAPPAPTAQPAPATPSAPVAQPAPATPASPVARPAPAPQERGRREAQAPTPAPAAPRAPRRPTLPINVQVDIIVTEQTPATPPIVRRAQLMTADGESTSVRNHSMWRVVDGPSGDAPFRIDLQADVLEDGKVRLRIGVDYGLARPGDKVNGGQVTVRQAVIVRDGQSVVIAETADPVTDRTVKIEAKANIVK